MKPLIKPERVRELVQLQYAAVIEDVYGEIGVDRLIELAIALDLVHTQLAFELRKGVTVCIAIADDARLLSPAVELPINQLATVVEAAATIQILAGNQVLVAADPVDPVLLAADAVVYHFDGADSFVVNGQYHQVLNYTTQPSIFGTPMFMDLEEALAHYAVHMALHCQCPVLRDEAWHDEYRLLLINKPEKTLQRSLYNFLRASLRGTDGIETRREQIIGEKWRTDIKVTWALYKRVSYLEVKWMGLSVNKDQTRISSFAPDEEDANQGARQLANYLDTSRDDAPTFDHHGVLVVFDARRRGVDSLTSTVSREEGVYYRNRDVRYDPDIPTTRFDFAAPRRFFMEPDVSS